MPKHLMRLLADPHDPARADSIFLVYLDELLRQTDFSLSALDTIDGLTQSEVEPGDPNVWYHVQALLTSTVVVNRLLTGPKPQKRKGQIPSEYKEECDYAERRGEYLRAACAVARQSVLLDSTVRNAFEHFDERLDRFLRGGEATESTATIDSNIVTSATRAVHYTTAERTRIIHAWRELDTYNGYLSFGEDRLDLWLLRRELVRLKSSAGQLRSAPRPPSLWAVPVYATMRTVPRRRRPS